MKDDKVNEGVPSPQSEARFRRRMRFDLEVEVLSFDETSGTLEFRAIPNRRRYERREIDGTVYYYDRLDDLMIPESVVVEMVRGMQHLPVGYQSPLIADAPQYVEDRRSSISEALDGKPPRVTFADASESFLRSLEHDKLDFVALVADMVGSTKLSTSLDPSTYAAIVATLLQELSEAVPLFHGYVLKYTGDGLVAYYPAPSFIIKNDLAIDCALTMQRLVYGAMNPELTRRGLPTLGLRVGIEAGQAVVVTIGSPAAKQHRDIIGEVVNLAAKFQSLARPGDILMGDTAWQNLHTGWRLIFEAVQMPPDWPYHDQDGKPYIAHRVIPGRRIVVP